MGKVLSELRSSSCFLATERFERQLSWCIGWILIARAFVGYMKVSVTVPQSDDEGFTHLLRSAGAWTTLVWAVAWAPCPHPSGEAHLVTGCVYGRN